MRICMTAQRCLGCHGRHFYYVLQGLCDPLVIGMMLGFKYWVFPLATYVGILSNGNTLDQYALLRLNPYCRWNYLLRIKTHTRVMPFLLPPPDFKPQELDDLGLTGTCEVQVCRSAGNWSMGFQHHVEHSIQNAYLKGMFHLIVSLFQIKSSYRSYSNVRTFRLY